MPSILFERKEYPDGIVNVEGVDVDDADLVLDLPLDRLELDRLAGEGDVEGLVAAGAHDSQRDLAARRAAHLVDGLVERAAIEQAGVEMGDVVTGLEARLVCRSVLLRRHDLDRAVFHRDREAEAAIAALGLRPHILAVARVEIGAVRIEAREHAVDRALHQRAVVDLVDIIGAHPLEHAHELIEFLIGADVDRADRGRESGNQRAGAEKSNRTQQGLRLHKPRSIPRAISRRRDIHRFGNRGKQATWNVHPTVFSRCAKHRL